MAEQINARWVDRIHSQWVARYARVLLERGGPSDEKQALYERYYELDIDRTRAVIRDKAPELIIQATYPEAAWLTEALLAKDSALLDDYEVLAEEGIVRVWRRKPQAEAGR